MVARVVGGGYDDAAIVGHLDGTARAGEGVVEVVVVLVPLRAKSCACSGCERRVLMDDAVA